MLSEIYIENIALISKLRLSLQSGFNVLTGETGAGKSILLDAMALILGAKADTNLIRHGEEKAIVEAVFCDLPPNLCHKMVEYGIEGSELILTREVTNGRSVCRINGRTYPLALLREMGQSLINIYGQHDYQNLTKPEKHLQLLDALVPETNELKEKICQTAAHISELSKQLKTLQSQAQETVRELDYLRFQAQEIDDASLCDNEEEELSAKQKLFASAEKITNALSLAHEIINGNQKDSVSDLLVKASKNLHGVSDCSDEIANFSQLLNDITVQTDDLALEIRSYLDNFEFDPKQLHIIEDRLYQIKTLKKKYGNTIAEILSYRQEIEKKLNTIENSAENEAQLIKQLDKYKIQYEKDAAQLTLLRQSTADLLKKDIVEILKQMNMSAEIDVKFKATVGYQDYGRETAEFYICTNAGDVFKPLAKIASGGELARVMLALRTVLNSSDPVPTLVFDEVDAGMGGITLAKVADKITNLAHDTQILCVTHSAQLAAKAQSHFSVSKKEKASMTFTNVRLLTKQERVQEIARMLDGKISNTSMTHAAELLQV